MSKHSEDSDINMFPKEGMRVFKKSEKSSGEQFIANTVVEFPIDPRAWIAGMAMQGLIGSHHYTSMNAEFAAKEAVKYTDALLKELNKLN